VDDGIAAVGSGQESRMEIRRVATIATLVLAITTGSALAFDRNAFDRGVSPVQIGPDLWRAFDQNGSGRIGADIINPSNATYVVTGRHG
jgi:hypothetical protein